MKSQKKKYSRPQKPFDKVRIEEENILKEKYGLKNKREIWKADAAIGRIRNQAKKLITGSNEDKISFIEKLKKKGFEVEKIADVLGLNKEDWLKRRLQTVVHKKGLANTPKQARQFITHKHIFINDGIVNKPSYQVSLEEESLIRSDLKLKLKEKMKDRIEEIKSEILEEKNLPEEKIEEKQEVKAEKVPAEIGVAPEKLNEPIAPEIEVK